MLENCATWIPFIDKNRPSKASSQSHSVGQRIDRERERERGAVCHGVHNRSIAALRCPPPPPPSEPIFSEPTTHNSMHFSFNFSLTVKINAVRSPFLLDHPDFRDQHQARGSHSGEVSATDLRSHALLRASKRREASSPGDVRRRLWAFRRRPPCCLSDRLCPRNGTAKTNPNLTRSCQLSRFSRFDFDSCVSRFCLRISFLLFFFCDNIVEAESSCRMAC